MNIACINGVNIWMNTVAFVSCAWPCYLSALFGFLLLTSFELKSNFC